MDGRMDGWKDGRMDGWMEGWMNVDTYYRQVVHFYAEVGGMQVTPDITLLACMSSFLKLSTNT
jgi:hypothetical protein